MGDLRTDAIINYIPNECIEKLVTQYDLYTNKEHMIVVIFFS